MALFTAVFVSSIFLCNGVPDHPPPSPERVVACCHLDACSLTLPPVSPNASLNWTDPITGAIPDCFLTGLCIANRSGLYLAAEHAEDGYYTATAVENGTVDQLPYYLMYLNMLCPPEKQEEENENLVAKPFWNMPMTTISVQTTLFGSAFLSLPASETENMRSVRWYKETEEYRALKVSRVRPGKIENVKPDWALADRTGDLAVLHISPQTLGLWVALVHHSGGRLTFTRYNVTIPAWQQQLVNSYIEQTTEDTERDPVDMSRKFKWALLKQQRGGAYRVSCNSTGRFPVCLDQIDAEGTYILMGESKATLEVMVIAFYPPYDLSSFLAAQVSNDSAVKEEPPYSSLSLPLYLLMVLFFALGILVTFGLMVSVSFFTKNKYRIYSPANMYK